jgi:dinuclear metal center YbgI/SA1388 family protein
MKVADVVEILEKFAPKSLAREGDNIGLLIGSLEAEVKGILISLDATLMALQEAAEKKANLLISHHPLIFQPLRNLINVSPSILFAVKNDISVYSAHTNLDVAEKGIGDALSKLFDLVKVKKLDKEGVKEEKAMGRVGYLKKPLSLKELAVFVAEKLNVKVKVLGEKDKLVRKVALCGGGGSGLLFEAYKESADVFITGDVNHHAALLALELGIALIDATHLATERVILNSLKEYVSKNLEEAGEKIPVYVYEEKIPWWEEG